MTLAQLIQKRGSGLVSRFASRAAVTKALASGRITAGADGRFDLARARTDWKANTRPSMPRMGKSGGEQHSAVGCC